MLERLGLAREDVSTQVVPRDRHAELLGAIALAGAGLERFATEIRHLQRTEVREVEEPFRAGAQKGSSAMPHKRNPIVSERITGIARLLRGYAQAGLENVALWHERDISHSSVERVALPDATTCSTTRSTWPSASWTGMVVDADRMRANLELTHGALYSQRALLALVEAGRSRDDAYRVVQEAAQRAYREGIHLRELLAESAPELDLDASSTRALSSVTRTRSSRAWTGCPASCAQLPWHKRRLGTWPRRIRAPSVGAMALLLGFIGVLGFSLLASRHAARGGGPRPRGRGPRQGRGGGPAGRDVRSRCCGSRCRRPTSVAGWRSCRSAWSSASRCSPRSRCATSPPPTRR